MNITILNVAVETKPTAKGSYQVADVAFKNNSFGGKVEGKKVMSFGATAEAFKALAVAAPNDTFEVTVVKNDKGYNDWVSLSKGGVQSANSAVQGMSGQSKAGSATPTPRGNFETPEERAKRQVYIIRQSSLSTAAAVLGISPAKLGPSPEAVIEMAKKFEAYVFGVGSVSQNLTGFDDVPDFDPSFNNEPSID